MTRPLLLAGALALGIAGAAVAGIAVHSTAATKVTVTEREFRITLAPSNVAEGPTTFVVKNTGKLSHALALSGPGVANAHTRSIAPGKTARLTVTLEAGTYSVWCPVPGHAGRGMKAKLTVTDAASGGSGGGGSPGSTGDTTTGDGGAAWG
jgi:uncharacterized cupredoxin-like copper-binding protein